MAHRLYMLNKQNTTKRYKPRNDFLSKLTKETDVFLQQHFRFDRESIGIICTLLASELSPKGHGALSVELQV
jgi:hypothetical protein